jgi:hypothetical protein
MQRDSIDPLSLTIACVAVALLVIYEALSTIYYLLPPLFGFAFAFASMRREPIVLYSAIVYIVFYEADHSHIVGSCVLFLLIYVKLLLPRLRDVIFSARVVVAFSCFFAYFGYFIFMNVVLMIFGAPTMELNWLLFYYAGVESALAMILIRKQRLN